MKLLTGYAKPVVALAITPDGKRLFSAAQGQSTIWEWELPAAAVTRKLTCSTRGNVTELVMSPRGDFFVSASGVMGVNYWPLTDVEQPRQLDLWTGEHAYSAGVPAWRSTRRPDRGGVVTPQEGRGGFGFRTWDLADEDRCVRRAGHTDDIVATAFSPGGEVVATASLDGTVRLWASTQPASRSASSRRGPPRRGWRSVPAAARWP